MAKKAGAAKGRKGKKPTFPEVVTAAVADLTQHGYDSQKRIDDWIARLREAANATLLPEAQLADVLREKLAGIYRRMIDGGGAVQYHAGVSRYTLDKVKPALRAELARRIHASADLIRRNRDEAISDTLRRFQGWATSVPPGGSHAQDKPEVKAGIGKALKQLTFAERRVIIDQGHKLTANINDVVAKGGGAIAMRWRSNWRQRNYDFRPDHKERDEKVYLIRDSWAHEKGLVKPGPAGYLDAITQPAEEVFCRCFGEYIYSPRRLPDDMVTAKGRAAMAEAKAKAAAL